MGERDVVEERQDRHDNGHRSERERAPRRRATAARPQHRLRRNDDHREGLALPGMQPRGERAEHRRRPERSVRFVARSRVAEDRSDRGRDSDQRERVPPRPEREPQVGDQREEPAEQGDRERGMSLAGARQARPDERPRDYEDREHADGLPEQQRQPGRNPEPSQNRRDDDNRLQVVGRAAMEDEQIRDQQVPRRRLDPGDVLHLVGQEQTVGARPRSIVSCGVPDIEPEHPHRHGKERHEHAQLKPVKPPNSIASGPLDARRCSL